MNDKIKICLACTESGAELNKVVLDQLNEYENLDITTFSSADEEIYDLCIKVTDFVLENPQENRGIIIDSYGVVPFMITSKIKYIICSETNDEHSAKMTRRHNNANIISMGQQVVAESVGKSIVDRFIKQDYDGGRHQIRIDMLNKMA